MQLSIKIMKLCILILALLTQSLAYSQIILPKEFNKCKEGAYYSKRVSIHSFEIWHPYKSAKQLKQKIDNDSELCCGKTVLTKDNLVIQSGTTDTEGEGAGIFITEYLILKLILA